MANLDDKELFGKSVSDMTEEELNERIKENRATRRDFTSARKKPKRTANIKKSLEGLSTEDLDAILLDLEDEDVT